MTTRIVEVAPGELIIAANIRKDTKITKEFVASVKQHGVLVPILATETVAGLEVTDGQRRTLAAVDAGRATVPVIVTDAAATDAERIVEQIVVNEQREYLGNSEHVAAVKELALFGVSAAQIAKKTGVKREMVDTALAVAESLVATAALEQQVSLMDAAALVEFEAHPEIVESLLAELAAGRGIQHTIARHRSELVEAAARAVVVAEILAAGHELLEQGPSWDDPRIQRADRLYTSKELTTQLDEETMISEAGADLRAFPRMKYGDWLEGGGRAPNTWSIGFAVTNWEAHGWFVRDIGGRSEPAKGPLSDDEKAARRQARENTTLWVAATTVRLEWLAELVGRKTLPAGWEPLVVARMIDNASHGTSEWRAAIAMLGLVESADTYSMRGVVQHELEASPKTVLHTALAVALGSIEGGYEFDRKGWQQGKTPGYLKLLASWGYELSELEQSIVTAAAL